MYNLELTRKQLWTIELALSNTRVTLANEMAETDDPEVWDNYQETREMDSIVWALLFPKQD